MKPFWVIILAWALPLIALAQTPVFFQNKSLDVPVGEPATSIFFTFDDGPTPAVTLPIAEVLADHQALATFFVVGNKSVSDNARFVLEELTRQGHLIGNHTWAHQNTFYNEGTFERSLRRTTAALADFLPASNLVFFRAPGGVWNRDRARWANLTRAGQPDLGFAWYVGPIRWNVGGGVLGPAGNRWDAADWECWQQGISVRECADGYLAKIRANHASGQPSVVLMHDLRIQTRQLLAYVLQGLANDGVDWQFKRLDMAAWPFSQPTG